MIPTVGRIVHYVARGSADGKYPPVCRAAVVTDVHHPGEAESVLSLCVLNPTGVFFDVGVYHNDENAPGTWHWPERA